MGASHYRELEVWQLAMNLVAEAYRVAASLPSHERFELANQIRRAAVSVPANIAEGNGRSHRREYVHHLFIARGSLYELDTQLEIALRAGYASPAELESPFALVNRVSRMLLALSRKLQS